MLVSKSIERANGSITTSQYRGGVTDAAATDVTTVSFDGYGRTNSVVEGGALNGFTRQSETEVAGASAGVSEVVGFADGNEGRSYTYSYDDFNNCTGYTSTAGHGNFSVERTGENTVSYNNSDSRLRRHSEVSYDDARLLSPRVLSTNDFRKSDTPECMGGSRPDTSRTVSYGYDALGRVAQKHTDLNGGGLYSGMRLLVENSYVRGTLLKSRVSTGVKSHGGIDAVYEYNYRYDSRGRIESVNPVSVSPQFTYDRANRLLGAPLPTGGRATYEYNADGSMSREFLPNFTSVSYRYENGRLKQRGDAHFTYDNLGNCTNFGGVPLTWHRGSLLQTSGSGAGVTYYNYNAQGVRWRKVSPAGQSGEMQTSVYFCDGDKLVAEERSRGGVVTRVSYLYDAEGVTGFCIGNDDYYFVKDLQGSVTAVYRMDGSTGGGLSKVAGYSYDSWGNCVVENVGSHSIGGVSVAEFNPVRRKSLYWDSYSAGAGGVDGGGFYYIDGRYYSPVTKQFISPESAESAVGNAGVIYGLNLYLLCVDNPVNLVYNGHTIETNGELSFEPEVLGFWRNAVFRAGLFFGTRAGRFVAAYLFVAAITIVVLSGGVAAGVFFGVGVGVVSVIGMARAGFRARDSGEGFWDGVGGFIRDDWAMQVAVSSVLAIATVGVSKAVGGVISASKKGLVNAKNAKVQKWLNANVASNRHADILEAFGSNIKVATAKKNIVANRYWGGKSKELGHWLTPNTYNNPVSSLALYKGSTASNMSSFIIPKGATYLKGTVASTATQLGGGFQFYISNISILIPM